MGFSLKKLGRSIEKAFRPITKAALPAVGSFFGIPPSVTTALTTKAPPVYRAQPASSTFLPGEMVVPTLGAVANGGGASPVMGTAGVLVAGGTRIAAIMAKIAAHLGKRIAKWRVIDFIKKWGPFAASAALGITADEAIELWLAGGPRRRRARGISAADIRRTGRVLRQMDRFNDQVRRMCRQVAPVRRRAPARRRARR